MSVVAAPMTTSVVTRTTRRPYLSPMCPNSTAPSGRAAQPTPNVANAAMVPASGDALVKNSVPNTSAEAWA
jgi:hypothetical protein